MNNILDMRLTIRIISNNNDVLGSADINIDFENNKILYIKSCTKLFNTNIETFCKYLVEEIIDIKNRFDCSEISFFDFDNEESSINIDGILNYLINNEIEL